MKRRDFLASSLAATASTSALGRGEAGQSPSPREFYELRFYRLQRGPGVKRIHAYLRDAAIPALNRAGIQPVGVFEMSVGPESPSLYVLIPHSAADSVLGAWERVRADQDYQKHGAEFLNATSGNPAYVRVESWLLAAFATHPRIALPPRGARTFELRTYQSCSKKANLKKIEMFNSGETDIFLRAGFHPVFYGETLIGAGWPSLTYMLASPSLEARNKSWAAFIADPEWKKLSSIPEYTDQRIVSNITNYLLNPAPYSQI